jgi:hypothetical protein
MDEIIDEVKKRGTTEVKTSMTLVNNLYYTHINYIIMDFSTWRNQEQDINN